MFVEKFNELNEMKEDLSYLKDSLGLLDRGRYMLAYKDILRIAYRAESFSENHYFVIVSRIEKAYYCLSVSTLKACIEYAELLIKMTEEYLQLSAVNEFLNEKQVKVA
jgi:hypothetical protein